MDAPNFDRFRDYTAVRDFKTAVVNAATGEVLDCVSWQYRWHISHNGHVTLDKGSPPVAETNRAEFDGLLR